MDALPRGGAGLPGGGQIPTGGGGGGGIRAGGGPATAHPLAAWLARAPFPSVRTYLFLSATVFIATAYYQLNLIRDEPELEVLLKTEIEHAVSEGSLPGSPEIWAGSRLVQIFFLARSDSKVAWVFINGFFATLALLGQALVAVVFRGLSRQESHVLRDSFFNLLLFKLVFVTSLVGAGWTDERALLWLMATAFYIFYHLLYHTAYLKFKLMSSGVGAGAVLGRRVAVLFGVLALGAGIAGWVLVSRCRSAALPLAHLLFLGSDVLLMLLRTVHAFARATLLTQRVVKIPQDTNTHLVYYLDLGCALSTECVELAHNVHLMLHAPFGLNLACLFFFYHARLAYAQLVGTAARHARHRRLLTHIAVNYAAEVKERPDDQEEENEDLCVVCWEKLGRARRLPCGHSLHDWCLMWWLEQDASCPTCRRTLPAASAVINAANGGGALGGGGGVDEQGVNGNAENGEERQGGQQQQQQQTRRLFRFRGVDLLGFLQLPSFAIEFTHTAAAAAAAAGGGAVFLGGGNGPPPNLTDAQLAGMTQQVQEMFPMLSGEMIAADLRVTGSTQATIENILDGRLAVPLQGNAARGLHFDEEEDGDEDAEEDDEEEEEERRRASRGTAWNERLVDALAAGFRLAEAAGAAARVDDEDEEEEEEEEDDDDEDDDEDENRGGQHGPHQRQRDARNSRHAAGAAAERPESIEEQERLLAMRLSATAAAGTTAAAAAPSTSAPQSQNAVASSVSSLFGVAPSTAGGTSSSGSPPLSGYQAEMAHRRRDFILKYRRKYLDSERAADLVHIAH